MCSYAVSEADASDTAVPVLDRRMLAAQPVVDDIMIVIRNRLSTLTPQSGLTPTSLWTSVLDGANFTAIAAANGLDATLTYYNATITYHTVRLPIVAGTTVSGADVSCLHVPCWCVACTAACRQRHEPVMTASVPFTRLWKWGRHRV